MSQSTASMQCEVFNSEAEARAHGRGGIYYTWINNSQKQFPSNVESVNIMMPYDSEESVSKVDVCFVCLEWPVSKPLANVSQWGLSGTVERPTLTPSLNWVDQWHGWLTDGYLKSC